MPDTPELLSHIPNSGIVHLPGRRFPGIVMQGDSLFSLLQGVRLLLARFREMRDEERYYETLMIAETLYGQLQHYEETLAARGMGLPYPGSVADNPIHDDFEDKSTTG
jgi:hypothetical protein